VQQTHLTALNVIELNRCLLIAHRGYSQVAPENTLPAFRLALKAQCDLVEMDFHQTRDGQLIVIHDSELDRTTNARKLWKRKHIKVDTKTAAEILHLDAGRWFGSKYAGTRVPLLAQAVKIVQTRAVALLERKNGNPAACLQVLRGTNCLNRVVVQSFDWEFLRQLHELEPKLILAALGPPSVVPHGKKARKVFRRLNAARVGAAQKAGVKVVVWNKRVSARVVRLAHARGLKVWIYTINHPELGRRLVQRGVDGLITNEPSRLRKAIR
jgi:glycerophosphoryl diester phosphodiesterase